ncbi:hypothetical protein DEO72_LG6g1669 [Vigna unguiculata]|uniref:Uncharacterized protein n=1 Tax=Vigna unguiculata TaxID=3917 RepID=A0A4D6M6E9_VIGUN|nr:hypothetical protein DEO72_LG6g1669 [Vigna unguiculata]
MEYIKNMSLCNMLYYESMQGSFWMLDSPRREGDLPWERSGDNPLCPDSAESGNRCRTTNTSLLFPLSKQPPRLTLKQNSVSFPFSNHFPSVTAAEDPEFRRRTPPLAKSSSPSGGPSLWIDLVLDAKGTYPGNGRVITPCVQTLQSLGTVAGASHQELQCRLHNPDIESRILNY